MFEDSSEGDYLTFVNSFHVKFNQYIFRGDMTIMCPFLHNKYQQHLSMYNFIITSFMCHLCFSLSFTNRYFLVEKLSGIVFWLCIYFIYYQQRLFSSCVYFIYYKDCDNVGGSKIRLIIGK